MSKKDSRSLNVCVIGTGYVGLVSGTCFAEIGHNVVCVDLDEEKVSNLRKGIVPIYEPGLDDLVSANHAAGRLSFTTGIGDALDSGATVFFIAVGTPTDPIDGSADLRYVYAAAEDIAKAVASRPGYDSPIVVVTKSTVPVGTNRHVADRLGIHLPSYRYAVASNPEFLREGCAIADFMKPDRIVVGASCEKARLILEDLYRPLTRQGFKMLVTETVESAELTKYAANAFLAMKIGFINQIAALCEKAGGDVDEVVAGIGSDHRIGTAFLRPGPGYGGSCFPKDTAALARTANEYGVPMTVVEAVIDANEQRKLSMVDKIEAAVGGDLTGKRIAVLGLAFKADTDDMRDAPSLVIVPGLKARGAKVIGYDPVAADNARKLIPGIEIAQTFAKAVKGADAVVVLTEWTEFAARGLNGLVEGAASRVVVDLRNVMGAGLSKFDGEYHSIGRAPVVPQALPVVTTNVTPFRKVA